MQSLFFMLELKCDRSAQNIAQVQLRCHLTDISQVCATMSMQVKIVSYYLVGPEEYLRLNIEMF